MEKLGNNLGANIYILRSRDGLTQEDLEFKLGVSRQTVSKWEVGKSKPRTGNLEKLCKVFNVRMDQLLGKEEVLSEEDLKKIIEQIKKENIIDVEKLRKDLHLVEDIQNEVEKKTIENRNKRKKKEKRIFLFTLLAVFILYISYSTYKFIILTDINNKVSQYENASNYYCEIKVYENNTKKEKLIIWKKDNKYKVETYSYNDVGHEIMHYMEWVNNENNSYIKYDYNTENLAKYNNNDIKNVSLKQSHSIYSFFPDIIRNQLQVIWKNTLGLNRLYQSYFNDHIDVHINDATIQINQKTYLPDLYVRKEKGIIKRTYFDIQLNNVKEYDVIFKENEIK